MNYEEYRESRDKWFMTKYVELNEQQTCFGSEAKRTARERIWAQSTTDSQRVAATAGSKRTRNDNETSGAYVYTMRIQSSAQQLVICYHHHTQPAFGGPEADSELQPLCRTVAAARGAGLCCNRRTS